MPHIDPKQFFKATVIAIIFSTFFVSLTALSSYLPLPDTFFQFLTVWFPLVIVLPAVMLLGIVASVIYPTQWLWVSLASSLVGSLVLLGINPTFGYLVAIIFVLPVCIFIAVVCGYITFRIMRLSHRNIGNKKVRGHRL